MLKRKVSCNKHSNRIFAVNEKLEGRESESFDGLRLSFAEDMRARSGQEIARVQDEMDI
jgi:hypothetical protein